MGELKLSEIACEVPDAYVGEDEFGARVTKVLSFINFPDRNRNVFDFVQFGTSYILRLKKEVVDVINGRTIGLEHSIQLNPLMTDREIAKQILILLGQFVLHEFMENFRFKGDVLCNPHEGKRNDIIFKAVEEAAKDQVVVNPFNVVITFATADFYQTTDHKHEKAEAAPQDDPPVPSGAKEDKQKLKYFKFAESPTNFRFTGDVADALWYAYYATHKNKDPPWK